MGPSLLELRQPVSSKVVSLPILLGIARWTSKKNTCPRLSFFNIAPCQPPPTSHASLQPQGQGSLLPFLEPSLPLPPAPASSCLLGHFSKLTHPLPSLPRSAPISLSQPKAAYPSRPPGWTRGNCSDSPSSSQSPGHERLCGRCCISLSPSCCCASLGVHIPRRLWRYAPSSPSNAGLFATPELPDSSSFMSQVDHAFLFRPHLSIPPHLPRPSVPEALTLLTL